MKRHTLLLALGLGAALFALTGSAQNSQEKADLSQKVEALEKELVQAKAEIAGFETALTKNTETLDQIARWIEGQADSAAGLASTLDAAEDQGFTAGINFGSRETLLAGWRKALSETQKGLGKGKAKTEAKGTARR
jgi:chromosome segregation ATPase